ncbi:MAG: hypothetical protein KBS95_02450 [Alistipes sp.]|nr:hypothetical protein [Candidatus Alistipes equi]
MCRQTSILMEMDAYGITNKEYYPKEYDHSAGKDWKIKMDILKETIERVLEDEK